MRDLKNLRIGLIGAGKLGEALLRGLLAATALPRGHITATARRPERAEYLSRELDIHQHDVRLKRTRLGQGALGVFGLSNDSEIVLVGEERDEPLAKERMVVNQ